jgi:hypothetical protein
MLNHQLFYNFKLIKMSELIIKNFKIFFFYIDDK